ncbi:MAG: hypothetical protein WBC19_07015 [Pyrinomonadaceae bacterium]|nr:hypothetical protein [Chloracidobacterium sp.]MBP7415079.1 hypothetical protein [Pyrinomonadaceae bacterium]
MKTTIKLFLIVSMFCATVLADGNQGSGGYKCENGQETCPPPCTENCGGDFATTAPGDGQISVDILTAIAEEIYMIGF